jgi:hypothetical protein
MGAAGGETQGKRMCSSAISGYSAPVLSARMELPIHGLLVVIFGLFFLVILFFTVRASLRENILQIDLVVLANRWFQATLVDAYLGLGTFYIWVASRETSLLGRGIWLVLILLLGNLAMSAYVVIRCMLLSTDVDLATLLLRPNQAASLQKSK